MARTLDPIIEELNSFGLDLINLGDGTPVISNWGQQCYDSLRGQVIGEETFPAVPHQASLMYLPLQVKKSMIKVEKLIT